MRVGSDIDGVWYNFERSYMEFLVESKQDLKYKITKNHTACCWTFYECWGIKRSEFIAHCNDALKAGILYSGGTYDGIFDAVKRIKQAGHTIHVITARNIGVSIDLAKKATFEWIKANNLHYDTLTFSHDKTSVLTDIFVEDNMDNYDALEKAGTEVYLINRPWNLIPDNRNRIDSFTDFADIVLNKSLQPA